jgi:hypothetical protein
MIAFARADARSGQFGSVSARAHLWPLISLSLMDAAEARLRAADCIGSRPLHAISFEGQALHRLLAGFVPRGSIS